MRTQLRLRVGTCGALILLAFSGPARGQTPAASLPELAVLVGAQVEVVESSGSTVKGRLVEASETGLLLNIDGKNVRLAAVRVREVSRRIGDPLWNGALIGAAVGAACILIYAASVNLASGEWDQAFLVSAFYGAIGAGIGTAIDARIKRKKTVLFRAADSEVALVATITRHRRGIGLSLRF